MPMNRQITLAFRPVGFPKESDFKLVESPIPSPGEGEVLLRTMYLSVDPYMRGRMSDAKSYAAPVEIGQVMVGGAVSRIVESKAPEFAPGDIVAAFQRRGQILVIMGGTPAGIIFGGCAHCPAGLRGTGGSFGAVAPQKPDASHADPKRGDCARIPTPSIRT